MEPLLPGLKRVRRRLLAVRALEAALAGAIGGGALGAVVTLLRIIRPQAMPLAAAYPLLPLVLVPFGFAVMGAVRLAMGATLDEAARAADRAAGLKERLATALEVLEARGAAVDGATRGARRVSRPAAEDVGPAVPGAAGPSQDGGVRPARQAGLREAGLLDERLLEQARAAAEGLDVSRLPLARAVGRRARILLVGVLGLLAAGFIPSMGGPPLAPRAAEQAAQALDRAAREDAVAPALRRRIEQAVADLRTSGARRGTADQATAAVLETVARLDQARRDTLQALENVDDPDVRRMAREAARRNAQGAGDAAKDLAARLAGAPGSGGLPPSDRERLADSLSGAAVTAKRNDLDRLAAELAAAADAIRAADPQAAGALERLASAMTEALAETTSVGAAVVAAVGQARRALGLAETPAASASAGGPEETVPSPAAASGNGSSDPVRAQGEGAAGAGGFRIPAEVRPEDREVVRRYFGG